MSLILTVCKLISEIKSDASMQPVPDLERGSQGSRPWVQLVNGGQCIQN